MTISMIWRNTRMRLGICLLLLLLASLPAMAQPTFWASDIGPESITVAWQPVPDAYNYEVFIRARHGAEQHAGNTTDTSFYFRDLRPNAIYFISARSDNGVELGPIMARTEQMPEKPAPYEPPAITCPLLPDHVAVHNYVSGTQCQMVSEIVIDKTDLADRGFIEAVDVWGKVPGDLEVCFRDHGHGWTAFLDAAYAPRMVTELEHSHQKGWTCVEIDRAGTVVLLSKAPPSADYPEATLPSLPIYDAIPLSDCQIKLIETLFLRATPGGEIIALVWLNSELQVSELSGPWYKTEFEGKTGYISRYYRKVLRGGCG